MRATAYALVMLALAFSPTAAYSTAEREIFTGLRVGKIEFQLLHGSFSQDELAVLGRVTLRVLALISPPGEMVIPIQRSEDLAMRSGTLLLPQRGIDIGVLTKLLFARLFDPDGTVDPVVREIAGNLACLYSGLTVVGDWERAANGTGEPEGQSGDLRRARLAADAMFRELNQDILIELIQEKPQTLEEMHRALGERIKKYKRWQKNQHFI